MCFLVYNYCFFILVIFFSCFNGRYSAESILGCNGFIKSDSPIDFSKIEIKLLSKERNLKDRTECAPNNGYYFLPLYDPGEYILSVTSQDNWNFDPTEVIVKFDRVSDSCSKGEDINFYFKGFSIFGQVDKINSKSGPSGITITLLADLATGQKEINSVITKDGGSFKLSNVYPGSYTIKASHPSWKLSKNSITFEVKDNNYVIPSQSLLLSGYAVTGSVVSNQEPISQVYFILFASKNFTVDTNWLAGCETKPLDLSNDITDGIVSEMKQLCFVLSNEKGIFTFPSVPSGNYAILSFYKSSHPTKFDVHPKIVNVTVTDDGVVIKKQFQVVGFSVKGRVVSGKQSRKPLQGVHIRVLDLNISAITDVEGFYMLEGMKSGSYDLRIEADNVIFANNTVKISPNLPTLPDVYPTMFKVSGTVEMFADDAQLLITFQTVDKGKIKIIADSSNGHFEQYLPPGNYSISVGTSGKHPEYLWFSSMTNIVRVEDSPVSGIKFVQLKADLVGSINCGTEDCGVITVSIRDLKANVIDRVTAKSGKYKFENLLPGEYELAVLDPDNYCWENVVHRIHIKQVHSQAPEFRRSGVVFAISSTHDTQLQYNRMSTKDSSESTGVLDVKEGVQNFCLPGSGSAYEFKAISCHMFDKMSFKWTLGDQMVHLTAVSHAFTGSVISDNVVDDLYINVYGEPNATLKSRLGPLNKTMMTGERNRYTYEFEIQAIPNEQLTFIPESAILLFTPVSLNAVGPNTCAELHESFIGKQGLRFEGQVNPPLSGVQVTVVNDRSENITSTVTGDDGKFKFNPLEAGDYKLIAKKDGYAFSEPTQNGIFTAKKLAKIIVRVDDENNTTLPGVLISISGGQSYRQTSQTDDNGEISFTSLQPGEYYTRPVLKEYKFVPPHKVVNIFEGITLGIPFRAHRVLYSVFGGVVSLNGVPEKGVVVEAVGKTDGLCVQLQEEATSEENGSFRIRGLQPQCGYHIRAKLSEELSHQIQKVIPEMVYIQMNNTDVRGIHLRLVPKLALTDVSVLVSVSDPMFLSTLTVKLYRGGKSDDDPLTTVKLSDWKLASNSVVNSLNTLVLVMPVLPTNGENYYVRLDSTLSKNTYAYTSNVVHFVADRSFHLIRLVFKPQLNRLRAGAAAENETKNSYSTAVLIVLSVLAYWYREALMNALQGLPYVSITAPEFINRFSRRFYPKEDEVVVNNFMEFEEPSLTVVKRKIRPRRM